MNTTITLQLREFPVTIRDERSGQRLEDTIVLTKDRIRAAAEVGMDGKELIWRIYNRRGFHVLSIEKPVKREVVIALDELPHSEERGAEGHGRVFPNDRE